MSMNTNFATTLIEPYSQPDKALDAIPVNNISDQNRLAPLPHPDGTQRCSSDVLQQYANHPSAYLAMNRDTLHFTSPVADGFIAYRVWGRYMYQIGNVFAPQEHQARLLKAFCAFAGQSKKQICCLQLREHDISLYREAGFRLNQLGLSYTVDLQNFTMAGATFRDLRKKLSKARKRGVSVVELGVDRADTPEERQNLHRLTSEWLSDKGQNKKLIDFMIGEIDYPDHVQQRVFLAFHDAQPVGFATYVPSPGQLSGFMCDLTRRLPSAPPGVMELINSTAIDRFKAEGIRYHHFGLTPCVGISEKTDNIDGRSKIMSWFLHKITTHGKWIYPAQSQVVYKQKWRPSIIVPEYIAYQGRLRLGNILSLLRLTRAV